MVQQPAVTSASPWTHPDGLTDLLDYLREQGYDVTVREYAAIQDLILALIVRGKDVCDPEVIKACFAPVICASPREQANFPSHFDRWRAKISSQGPIDHPDKQSAETEIELADRHWRTWRWILIGFVAVLIIAIAWFWRHSHAASAVQQESAAVAIAPGVPPVNPRVPLAIAVYTGVGVTFTLVSWGLWWYYRGRLFLSRRTTTEGPDIVSVKLEPGSVEHFERDVLKQTCREFRRRYPVSSGEMAIAATVEETVRHCGRFTPVFGARLVAPEYLALIDRRTFRDHNSRYADELLNYLTLDQVRIERLYFDSDVRTLFSSSPVEPPLTLRDLSVRHRDHRLLIFTDGSGLFDSVSGELDAAMESLWTWPSIGIFTPKPEESWGYTERVLADRVFLQPANLNSLLLFARHMNGSRFRSSDSTSITSAYPAELAQRPNRWLERDSPQPELVRQVMQSLRWYLGDEGYFWLSACAVYPEIHFNLTMYLGANLKDENGKPLFGTERLKAISRLPWLRQAYMPNWLRLELVTSLSHQQNSQIREVLDRLWLAAASGSSAAITIEIARRHRRVMTALTWSVFYRLRSKSPRDGPLRDYVFASVMLGRSLEPLAVRVPRKWRDLLRRRRRAIDTSVAPIGPLTEVERVIDTFTAPSKTFTDIRRNANWIAPWLLMSIVGLAMVFVVDKKLSMETAYENQMRQRPKQMDKIDQMPADQKARTMQMGANVTRYFSYGSPVLMLIYLGVIAAVLKATFKFGLRAELTFKHCYAISMYAFLPGVIRSLLAILIVLVGGGEGFTFQNPVASNLGGLVDPNSSHFLYSVLSSLDAFNIWILILTGIGYSCVTKVKRGTCMAVVFGWWAVVTLVGAGIGALFA